MNDNPPPEWYEPPDENDEPEENTENIEAVLTYAIWQKSYNHD